MEFKEEYKKFIVEENNLLRAQFVTLPNFYTENNIQLLKIRHNLKSLIFNQFDSQRIQPIVNIDEINFLKEYREYIASEHQQFPNFIFDDFDAEKFEKCIQYKYSGRSLLETEEYYNDKIRKQKIYK